MPSHLYKRDRLTNSAIIVPIVLIVLGIPALLAIVFCLGSRSQLFKSGKLRCGPLSATTSTTPVMYEFPPWWPFRWPTRLPSFNGRYGGARYADDEFPAPEFDDSPRGLSSMGSSDMASEIIRRPRKAHRRRNRFDSAGQAAPFERQQDTMGPGYGGMWGNARDRYFRQDRMPGRYGRKRGFYGQNGIGDSLDGSVPGFERRREAMPFHGNDPFEVLGDSSEQGMSGMSFDDFDGRQHHNWPGHHGGADRRRRRDMRMGMGMGNEMGYEYPGFSEDGFSPAQDSFRMGRYRRPRRHAQPMAYDEGYGSFEDSISNGRYPRGPWSR